MSVTLLALKRLIAKDSGLGYSSGIPTTGGASKTVLVDTSADSPFDTGDSASLYANAWVMIEADSAGTPLNVGEISRVTTYAPSTQTLTLGRAFTNNITTTMTYGCYFGVAPARQGLNRGLEEFINERLRNLFYKDLFLVTDVTDGDMEASGTTNYSGTNATLAKATTGAGITAGDQALEVTTTAANGYATLATALKCTANEIKEVVVDCAPTSGIWKLQAYDVTNGAEIDVTDSYDGVQPRRLWLRVVIPSGCETWNVRLIGETITTVGVFDNLSIRDTQQKFLNLPTWLIRPEWLEEVYVYPQGTLRDNAYAIGEWNREMLSWWDIQESFASATPLRLELVQSIPQGAHVFISAIRPYAELATDSATSDIDQDYCKWATLMDIYMSKDDEVNYKRAASMYQVLGLDRHTPEMNRRALRMARP